MRRDIERRDRILAPLATRDADGNVTGANLGALIRRLILFEEVVIDSYGMRELRALIDALGAEQFVELLESRAVLIRGDGWVLGEVGNAGVLDGRGPLPPLLFSVAPLVPRCALLIPSLHGISRCDSPSAANARARAHSTALRTSLPPRLG